MSVRRPFSPPLHSAAHYTRKHLHADQPAAPPNHAEWADAKRVRSISTVRSVRFEPPAMSALPPKADIERHDGHVRLVSIASSRIPAVRHLVGGAGMYRDFD